MTIIPWEAMLKGSWRGFINLLKFTSCGDCVWIAEQEVNNFFAILLSVCSLSTIPIVQQKNLWQSKLSQVAIAAINFKWLKMLLAMNLTLEVF